MTYEEREKNLRRPIEIHKQWLEKLIKELELVSSIPHNAESGHEAEEIIKNFLKEYLPKKFSITSGFCYASEGISNQSDIILYDCFNYPILFSGYANKIVYYESVKAVIECSLTLTASKIEKDSDKFKNLLSIYDSDNEIKSTMEKPPLTVMFTYKTTMKEDSILDALNSLDSKNIDLLFCSGKGVFHKGANGNYICVLNESNFCGETIHGYTLTIQERSFHYFMCKLLELLDKEYSLEELKLTQRFGMYSNHIDYKK